MTGATALILGYAGLLGLVIGSFLNVVIARVPAGVSLRRESRCPRCQARVRWWQNVPVVSWLALRGRCAGCREPISPRYPLIELATGAVFVAVTAAWALASPLAVLPVGARVLILAALLWFAATAIALAMIDLDTHRLPHAVTTTGLVGCAVLLTAACLAGAPWAALLRAAIAAGVLYGLYALIRLVRPDGMGGGDVRLAALIGLVLGWAGWGPFAVGAFAAFALGAVVGLVLIATGRAGRRGGIPFGPWMLTGAAVGLIAGEPLSRAYLQLTGLSA